MNNVTEFVDLLQPLTAHSLSTSDIGRGQGALRTLQHEWPRSAGRHSDQEEDLDRYRKESWDAGYLEGYTAARIALEEEVRAGWSIERESLLAEIREITEGIQAARQKLWADQENEMLALVMDIAKQVIKTEIAQNSDIVLMTIRNAMRRITAQENIKIRVSAADSAHVITMHDELMTLLGGIQNLEVSEDRRIGPGGCIIQTAAETIDARIDTQTAVAAQALGLSEHE